MTHNLAVREQIKSSEALPGSVSSVEVSLITNIVTERLPGLDRKGENRGSSRIEVCFVLSSISTEGSRLMEPNV